jgi:hypothetical protein
LYTNASNAVVGTPGKVGLGHLEDFSLSVSGTWTKKTQVAGVGTAGASQVKTPRMKYLKGNQQKLYSFQSLALELIQHHFHYILCIEAIPKTHPHSRKRCIDTILLGSCVMELVDAV